MCTSTNKVTKSWFQSQFKGNSSVFTNIWMSKLIKWNSQVHTGRITGSSSLIMIKQHLTKHSNQVSCVHFMCDLILIDKYLQLLMIYTKCLNCYKLKYQIYLTCMYCWNHGILRFFNIKLFVFISIYVIGIIIIKVYIPF